MFFAPFILLFAVSGALQTFRLQEEKGYGGTPPTWIVWLASVHKDQAPPREPKAAKQATGAMADDHHHDAPHRDGGAKRPSPLPLKVFVALLSLALAVSTVMGIAIALANRATRRSTVALLIAGTVVPSVLLWL